MFKAATSRGGSAPLSTPSRMPFRQPGHLHSLLPCVTASHTHQGPCSHGWLPSACNRREHQLTKAENYTKLMLSTCLVASTYGCGTTGARECKDSLAASKRRGDKHARCNNLAPFTPLSPIPYSHLPADGTHYMFDLSTTQVHTFQSAVNEDGT